MQASCKDNNVKVIPEANRHIFVNTKRITKIKYKKAETIREKVLRYLSRNKMYKITGTMTRQSNCIKTHKRAALGYSISPVSFPSGRYWNRYC